jgi:hypothetical protein
MKKLLVIAVAIVVTGCATLTSDAMTPIALSFGDGSAGECKLTNKRGEWDVEIPTTASVRRSDDALRYACKTEDGREASGQMASTVGAKIVASAVFIDFGITDAITDKHREYPASFVIPVEAKSGSNDSSSSDNSTGETDAYAKLEELNALREKGIITDAEFDSEKKKLLDSE